MSTNNHEHEKEQINNPQLPPTVRQTLLGGKDSLIPLVNNPDFRDPISLFSLRPVPNPTQAYSEDWMEPYKPSRAVNYVDTDFWFSNRQRAELVLEFPATEYIYSVEFFASCGVGEFFEYTIQGKKAGEVFKTIAGPVTRFIKGGWIPVPITPITVSPNGYYDSIKIIGESTSGVGYVAINEIYLR